MKISDYFGRHLLALIKKVLMKNLTFLRFSTYVLVTLIKSKLPIHPVNPTNPDIFTNSSTIPQIQIHHEVLINKVSI